MMHVTFYWGKELTLLVDSWKTDSWPSYGVALLLCFLLSIFHQRLEFPDPPSSPNPSQLPELFTGTNMLMTRKFGRKWTVRFAPALLFVVNSGIKYLIMLVIMSYNGGVFVAVILGLIVGYYVFRTTDFGDTCDDE